jgi:lysophospholipase L1-like esterase
MKKKLEKLLKNLLLSFISLVIFISIAELLTRIFWDPRTSEDQPRVDIILDGVDRTFTHEGITYQTNSFGIRNKEISTHKDSLTYRILCLGDSYTWGAGLEEEQLVTLKLESLLNDRGDTDFQVINAGIPGTNTQDQYEQLIKLHPIYKPNHIIQFFFTNDLIATNDSNQIADWKINTITWLRQNSRFYSFVYYLIKSSFNKEVAVPQFLLPNDYFNLDDSKPGWVAFKNYFTKIKLFTEEKKIGYTFVMIPTLTNLDENYPYQELRTKVYSFAKSQQIPVLDFFDLFANYNPLDLWVSKQNTHWNNFATTIAADTLSKFLLQNLHKFYPPNNPTSPP